MAAVFTEAWSGTNGDAWNATRWPTVSGGTGGTVDIQSSKGRMQTGTVQWDLCQAIPQDVIPDDFEATGSVTITSATETYPFIIYRCNSTGNNYFQLTWLAPSDVVAIERRDNFVPTTMDSDTLTVADGDTIHWRLRVVGSDHKLRCWVNGASEPGTWLLEFTDSTYAAQNLAIFGVINGGTTSRRIDWDDVTIDDLVTNATATPSVVSLSAATPAPTVAASASAAPSVVSLSASVHAPSVAAGAAAAPSVVAVSASVPSPTVAAGATVAPATVALSASVHAPTVLADATVAADAIAVAASVHAPTVSVETSVDVTPAAISVTVTAHAPTVSADATISAGVVSVAATLDAPSVSAGATISPATIAVAAATRTSSPRTAIGVNSQVHWIDTDTATRDQTLDLLAYAGVTWVRIDMGWATVEEGGQGTQATWYLTQVEGTIDAAIARGMDVLVVWKDTPTYAGATTATPPSDPQDCADALGDVVSYFAGRVSAWEIWNEPNQAGFWSGTPAQYVDLLEPCYTAVKAADPSALVVLGGPAYNDTGWLADVFAAGAVGSFDVLATHPYMSPSDLAPTTADTDGTNIWLMTHVDAVRAVQLAAGDSSPIWFTEFGWSSHEVASEHNWLQGVSEAEQASYLTSTISDVIASRDYIEAAFWYGDRNRGDGTDQENNYGLLTVDDGIKPSYLALRELMAPKVEAGAEATPATVPLAASVPAPTVSYATLALAQLAAATGTAYDAVARVVTNAALATATATANAALALVRPTPTTATATGTAYDPSKRLTSNATTANATGVANNASISLRAPASEATASGVANSGTDRVSPVAITAMATSTANDASVVAGNDDIAPADAATGTGTAYLGTTNVVSRGHTHATATGVAQDPDAALRLNAALASAAGVAYNASVTTFVATNASAQLATGTATAYNASVRITTNAAHATAVGVANSSMPKVGPSAVVATAAGVTFNPNVRLTSNASAATATGTANVTGENVRPNAAPATAAGVANTSTPRVLPNAALATAVGLAYGATPRVVINGSVATALAVAYDPSNLVVVHPSFATALGVAFDAEAQQGARSSATATLATAAGTAYNARARIVVNATTATAIGFAWNSTGGQRIARATTATATAVGVNPKAHLGPRPATALASSQAFGPASIRIRSGSLVALATGVAFEVRFALTVMDDLASFGHGDRVIISTYRDSGDPKLVDRVVQSSPSQQRVTITQVGSGEDQVSIDHVT